MSKKIKLGLFAEPGTGKSVFAFGASKPFFICTDGNYEWLEDWGAKEEDHKQVYSWAEAKNLINEMVNTPKYNKYDTIVIDLLEDLFKWCEKEWVEKNNLQHVGDLGFGKGYDITRSEFFIEICKLLNLDKNVILIMHGLAKTVKDRRGVEYTKYVPTDKIPEKLLNQIEGRVRYFLRAFAVTEESSDGKLIVNRYLSLSPDGTTEYGITRGLDSTKIPRYIPLDWNTFYAIATDPKYRPEGNTNPIKDSAEPKVEVKLPKVNKQNPVEDLVDEVETKTAKVSTETKPEENVASYTETAEPGELEKLANAVDPSTITDEQIVTPVADKAGEAEKPAEPEKPVDRPMTNAEKIAALKAKMKAKQLGN